MGERELEDAMKALAALLVSALPFLPFFAWPAMEAE